MTQVLTMPIRIHHWVANWRSLACAAPFGGGTGNLIEGMDVGLKGMKTGEIRRLFVPGELGFEKGLPAAPGRARVLPKSDLVIDLELLYIPGLSDF